MRCELENTNNHLSQYHKLEERHGILDEILIDHRSPHIETGMGFEEGSSLVKGKEEVKDKHAEENHKPAITCNPSKVKQISRKHHHQRKPKKKKKNHQ